MNTSKRWLREPNTNTGVHTATTTHGVTIRKRKCQSTCALISLRGSARPTSINTPHVCGPTCPTVAVGRQEHTHVERREAESTRTRWKAEHGAHTKLNMALPAVATQSA